MAEFWPNIPQRLVYSIFCNRRLSWKAQKLVAKNILIPNLSNWVVQSFIKLNVVACVADFFVSRTQKVE